MVYKYHHDQSAVQESKLTTDSFASLEQNMLDRIVAIPDSVKRRVNYSEQTFDYTPHQASYRALMHLNDLYSGVAIVTFSRDCDNWYEDYSVQLKPTDRNNAIFDYKAKRMESLSSHRAEIVTSISSWYNGREESTEEVLRFQRIGGSLELRSEGQTAILDSATKLNIESSRYVLRQIEQENFTLEYQSEPDEFSQFPINNKVSVAPYKGDALLDQLWVIKTEEYKDEGNGYELSSTTIEMVNDRAVTLYAATLGNDGLLYELVIKDFEYLATRCMKSAAL